MSLLPIPNGLVALTFDDGNKSDFTYVAPLLKQYGFGASQEYPHEAECKP